ncbi:LPD7 domain-containing protein [Piscinibacter sp.]|uniref:LPD7 domain-containing protein n=1 Tax=Piscinibacter sp. TaxID=1903157 RepID=UPI00258B5ECC|nr:LPD7 domain-containing protein [Piscinibacter sp.]
MGGTVEPVRGSTGTKTQAQRPVEVPGERYELRDPFAEVTYRSDRLREIVAKAERLGSDRFVAIDAEGRRTTVQKVDGEWQRGPQRAPTAERPLDPTPDRTDEPERGKVVPMKTTARESTLPHAGDAARSAKVDIRADVQAERAARVARLEASLSERYVIKRAPVTIGDLSVGNTEYRFRGDTSRVAFTESTLRLATDTNSPSVARSMVDVAEARNWRALRVSGHEDFKRMVWLEASVRGVKTLGYEPNPGDLELLKKEREARMVNRVEREHAVGREAPAAPSTGEKGTARGNGGRKAVLAAIDAVLVAKQVPAKRREAIINAATEQLAKRVREGQVPKVKVYDKAAPSQRPVVVPTPEAQRTRERAAPMR